MIHHIDLVVSDFARSRAFYVQALEPLAMRPVMDRGPALTGFGTLPDPVFWIRAGTVAASLHVAFNAASRAMVEAFHEAALAAGGRNHGGPGYRPRYETHYYAACVLDPDGNNIEAVYRGR